MAPDAGRPGVCFVVTLPFHGATLLSLLLNNHSRISALGDTNPTLEFDQGCPCGEHVSTCPFWQAVALRTRADRFTGLGMMLPLLPWPLQRFRIEGRPFPVSPVPLINSAVGRGAAAMCDVTLPMVWRSGSRSVRAYVDSWRAFYEAVRDLHGTSIVVDGSKSSRKAQLMARELAADMDVRVIHLVRDPRGFAASWWHNNARDDPRTLAAWWRAVHSRAADLQHAMPYKLVRYCDLASDPDAVSRGLLAFLGVAPETVVAPPRYSHKHHVIGNNMLTTFDGNVRLDERWRTELSSSEQEAVLRRAGELAERWGYTKHTVVDCSSIGVRP